MILFWICSALAIVAAGAATLFGELKRAVLALWVCALALGGMFLTLNAEYLAIVQWIVSTLAACSFVFYSVLLGSSDGRQNWIRYGVGLGVITVFSLIIWMTVRDLSPSVVWDQDDAGLVKLGRALVSGYLLPLEILSLTLFLVIVGVGVISRPEPKGAAAQEEADL